MEARNSFVFYGSFYEAIKDLPRDVQGEVYTAIMEYGLYGITTDQLKPVANAIFKLIKPQLDANTQRYENGKKGAEHGKKGGRPPKEETPNKPLNNPTETPNVNVNDNVIIKKSIKEKATRFSPPSLDEVKSYFENDKGISKKESTVRAEKFFLHYDSNGWKVGKNKMVNWKSAATKSLSWDSVVTKQEIDNGTTSKIPTALLRGG